ncbi:MAG: ParB N-terminal domain-containing protein [Acidimicrobiia bacterium]
MPLSLLSDVDRSSAGETVTTAALVPLGRIIGTVARCCDFDRCFRPLRPHLRRRLSALRDRLRDQHLPTIRLRQVGDDYYVIDGHHRLAIAHERGMFAMDAIVTCLC